MNAEELREILQQHWIHSHEEDTASEMVFRPAHFSFPPSRGRIGLELKADGTAIDYGIGPTDASQVSTGSWTLDADRRRLTYDGGAGESRRVMAIKSATRDRLVIEKTNP